MCRARLAQSTLLLLTAMGGGPVSATAVQSRDAAHYRALADSLQREWRRLDAAERRRDSLAAASVHLDTTRVGPMTVLSPSEHTERIVPAAVLAIDSLREVLGRDTMLLAQRYYVRPHGVRQPFTLPPDQPGALYRPGSSTDVIAHTLISQLEQDLAARSGPVMRAWAGGSVPFEPIAAVALASAYREIVGSERAGASDCLRGEVAVCAAILGVHDVIITQGEYPIQNARRTLLQVAIGLGGEGAYGRLVSADLRSVTGRLEAAAGVPFDDLMRAWHDAMIEARPEATMLTRAAGWVAFFWIVVLGTVASRSSRWRFV